MKTRTYLKQIFAAMLCVLMTLSMLPTSVFAAKEMFSACNYIGIRNCAIPVAGEKPDHSVDANEPGKYEIKTVNWYKNSVSAANAVGATETFKENTVYIVEFEVWAKGAYYFTNTNGNTTVTADVSDRNTEYGEFDAQVMNVAGQSVSSYLTVRCTFPKTEGKNTATQDPNIITKVNLTGLDLPSHYQKPDTTVEDDDYRVSTEVVWKNQDGSAFSGVFEYGKSYTAMIYLFVGNSYDFAKDYSHPLASAEKPMPAVTVTLDGEPLTVMPDYTRNQFMRCLVASKVYKCEGKLVIDSIRLSGVKEPTAGGAVNYNFNSDTSGYERLDSMNDSTYHKGVAWRVDGGIYLETSKGTFDANESYQIVIRLKPKEGFEFDADGNGNTRMTATVNGKNAEVKSSKTEAIVTYTFPKTGSVVLDKIEIGGVDIPEAGKSPDYTASYGANYGAADYNDKSNKNGISWYNETDKKTMSTTDKFEEGKTYSIQVMIWADDGYEFQYKSGQVNISATVNGQSAEVSSRDKEEVTVYYTFPKIAEHKHAPLKVDEVKATCKEVGKKAYYFCTECGKNFEDSKCSKEIANILTWGVIEKLEHTGGKATCSEKAKCKNCGVSYGELAAHNYGTAWDYKDEKGHAHKCKVCGAHDTVVAHTGSTAKCGEKAKCTVCKAEYGEPVQHKWGTKPEYTDNKGHAVKCTVCGEHDTVQAHTGGTADCKNKAKCSVCGTEYGKTGDHKWSSDWGYTDSKGHAHKCTVCGDHDSVVKHTPGAAATETTSQNCTVCGYIIASTTTHKHSLVRTDKIEATCAGTGMEAYYYCESCGGIFSDNKGNKEITDKDSLIIPAEGHKDSKWQSDADVHWKECSVKGCNTVTVEKEAHELNKAGKCTVCGYKEGAPDDTTDLPESDTDDETVTPDSTDLTDTTDMENTTGPADTDNEKTTGGTDTMIWVVIAAASAVIAVTAVIVTVVVIVKGKKK